MSDDEKTKRLAWYRERAVNEGGAAIDGMIKSFEFIIEQLRDGKTRWDAVAAMTYEENDDHGKSGITNELVSILSRAAQVASSQHNSEVGRAVRAAASLATNAGVEGILF